MEENDLSQFEDTIEEYFVGNVTPYVERELIPGGREIKVTEANKAEFIRHKSAFVAYGAVKA